jgi:V/A-type H+/Na+-transporting ATPase subunit F
MTKEIAVIGDAQFTLGFRLGGIKHVFDITGKNDATQGVQNLLEDDKIGIVVIDEPTMGMLDEHIKHDVVTSITPVFVTVSATAQQEELRKMILQSIGVDLLKEDKK